MKAKLLFYSALIFLILGLYAQDGIIYFFFAIYLLALAICVFFHRHDNKMQQK
jgi:hypothetical protein